MVAYRLDLSSHVVGRSTGYALSGLPRSSARRRSIRARFSEPASSNSNRSNRAMLVCLSSLGDMACIPTSRPDRAPGKALGAQYLTIASRILAKCAIVARRTRLNRFDRGGDGGLNMTLIRSFGRLLGQSDCGCRTAGSAQVSTPESPLSPLGSEPPTGRRMRQVGPRGCSPSRAGLSLSRFIRSDTSREVDRGAGPHWSTRLAADHCRMFPLSPSRGKPTASCAAKVEDVARR